MNSVKEQKNSTAHEDKSLKKRRIPFLIESMEFLNMQREGNNMRKIQAEW